MLNTGVCHVHRDQKAELSCFSCRRGLCGACAAESLEQGLCARCAEARRRKSTLLRFGVAAAVALAAVGGVAALVMNRPPPKAAAAPASALPADAGAYATTGFDYGEETGAVFRWQRQLEADACNKKAALELGNALNRAGDFEATLSMVRKFTQGCGEWPRLLWVEMYSREQKKDWKEAAEVATKLILDRPDDSDFWWWRGQAYAELGQYAQAAADYHQSMANLPNGFASGRFAKWAKEKYARPCDGAFALQSFISERSEKAGDWAHTRRSELFLAGGCERLSGKGRAEIRFPANAPIVKAQVKVNGKAATLLASERAGYTVLTRALAEAAGVELGDKAVRVWAAGELRDAKLATVERMQLGGAQAGAVDVAVVEELPGGLEGVLGQSFLWRFAVKRGERGLTLAPHPG